MQSNDFHNTDLGNAKRLVHYHGGKLRWVRQWGWLYWNGKQWEVNEAQAECAAKDIPAKIHLECAELPDGDERKALDKWAFNSEFGKRISEILRLARSEPEIRADSGDFDRGHWLLNLQNGTLDLKTGELLPHNPANMITKMAGVSFEPEADCPNWLKFLDEIMLGKQSLVTYIQRCVGYSLTGDTSEQCFFMPYGTGNNGKSTLLEIVAAMLGDYGKATDFKTFLAKDDNGPRNDLAALAGARFVMAKESERGQKLAESLLKTLTGQDTVEARFLNKEFFSFKPAFKIFLATNHKPMIRGQDLGIWRRVKLIPFEFSVPSDQIDTKLLGKLLVELPGILNWAMQGCLDWQRGGLAEPVEVTIATKAYRNEQDVLADFISTECTIKKERGKKEVKEGSKTLYNAYAQWCKDNSEKPISNRSFASAIRERGYQVEAGAGNQKFVKGLRLKTNEEKEAEAKKGAEQENAEDLFNSSNRINYENDECIEDVDLEEQNRLDSMFAEAF